MTPGRSSVPDDQGQPHGAQDGTAVSWGSRTSESETAARSDARSRASGETALVHCPTCGSAKTTVVQSADRGSGNTIRRDNPGYRCFACGASWTVTIGADREAGDA